MTCAQEVVGSPTHGTSATAVNEVSWECLACGAIRLDRSGACPTCGLKAGMVPSNVVKPIKTQPVPVQSETRIGVAIPLLSGDLGDAIIVLLPLLAFCVLGLFSIDQNFIPSDSTTGFGLFVWVPLGFAYVIFVRRRIVLRRGYVFNNLKSIIFGVIFTILDFLYIYVITIYGLPALVNRFTGEPFQAQAVITGKATSRFGPGLRLAGYDKALGSKVLTDESVYLSVREGDTVIVFGVESVVGRSIHTVIPRSGGS